MDTSRPFDAHPAFYKEDNRRYRGFNPTSKAFLEIKFGVLLPKSLIQGKRLLDLGSGNGAAGQWALFYGAAHYTGVEVQQNYVAQSQTLLAHWQQQAQIVHQDISSYLQQAPAQSFDIVLIAGALYHFVDTKKIIDLACHVSAQQLIIESNYPRGMRLGKLPVDAAITEYITNQEVNLDTGKQSMRGVSASSSMPALDILLRLNGFSKQQDKLSFPLGADTVIYDDSVLGSNDLPIRFAVRYFRDTTQHALSTLESQLPQQSGEKYSWEHDPDAQARTQTYQQQAKALSSLAKPGQWKFDAQVADVFDGIARREIPDYLRVIQLCVNVIAKGPLIQPKIIDVGSATGETLRQLHHAGYHKLYGVEASKDMIKKSFDQATLIHSEDFPESEGPFDYVLNNWTLHFIREPLAYLAAIKRAMAPGATLILSDKVSSSDCTHALYYDYKRAHGVSDAEIEKKRQQIEGVLVTYPLTWYLNALTSLGFEEIEIINANTAFVTFMARQPQ